MSTTQRIQKVTTKGQITLPVAWRNKFSTQTVLVQTKGDTLVVSPVEICEHDEYTVFDAIRDNKGKGIKAKDLVSVLDQIASKR